MSTTDDLIKKYATEIERINAYGTIGDGTWTGLLASFALELIAAQPPRSIIYQLPRHPTGGFPTTTFQPIVTACSREDDHG